MLVWLSVWSKVQTCVWPSWCHCHSPSLASLKSTLVLPFWYRLTLVVPEKGPLNVCVCVAVAVCVFGCGCGCVCGCDLIFHQLFFTGRESVEMNNAGFYKPFLPSWAHHCSSSNQPTRENFPLASCYRDLPTDCWNKRFDPHPLCQFCDSSNSLAVQSALAVCSCSLRLALFRFCCHSFMSVVLSYISVAYCFRLKCDFSTDTIVINIHSQNAGSVFNLNSMTCTAFCYIKITVNICMPVFAGLCSVSEDTTW